MESLGYHIPPNTFMHIQILVALLEKKYVTNKTKAQKAINNINVPRATLEIYTCNHHG
jgi:hypothetical protein